jgi:hypothetical protein
VSNEWQKVKNRQKYRQCQRYTRDVEEFTYPVGHGKKSIFFVDVHKQASLGEMAYSSLTPPPPAPTAVSTAS